MTHEAMCIFKMLNLIPLLRREKRSTDITELNETEKGMRASQIFCFLLTPFFIYILST